MCLSAPRYKYDSCFINTNFTSSRARAAAANNFLFACSRYHATNIYLHRRQAAAADTFENLNFETRVFWANSNLIKKTKYQKSRKNAQRRISWRDQPKVPHDCFFFVAKMYWVYSKLFVCMVRKCFFLFAYCWLGVDDDEAHIKVCVKFTISWF